jgi:hypothetical protein
VQSILYRVDKNKLFVSRNRCRCWRRSQIQIKWVDFVHRSGTNKKYIKNVDGKLVVICTYQNSDKLVFENNIFDFGIFDESHRIVGNINKHFSQMLTNKNLIIKRRLFMTATSSPESSVARFFDFIFSIGADLLDLFFICYIVHWSTIIWIYIKKIIVRFDAWLNFVLQWGHMRFEDIAILLTGNKYGFIYQNINFSIFIWNH